MTLVINLHNDGVLALHEQVADVVVESRKATDVVTSLLAVHPHMTVVVHSPEIEQRLTVRHRHGLETLLEPDGALVEEEALVLRVPVRRNLHHVRLVEVVLNQILWTLRLRIDKESVAHGVHTVVVVTLFLHVDDVVPLAVQRHSLIGLHILNQRQFLSLGRCRQHPAQSHT